MITEADTCRKYVLPKLVQSGWDNDLHSFTERTTFTDGRIVLIGEKVRRRQHKRADYLLRYTRDFLFAVVEAKAAYKSLADGLQQAKDYAEVLGLKFAYSTNGHGIVEFDLLTGQERNLHAFPAPNELWARHRIGEKLNDDTAADRLLTPYNHLSGKSPRYYQEIAIDLVPLIGKVRHGIRFYHPRWHQRADLRCRAHSLAPRMKWCQERFPPVESRRAPALHPRQSFQRRVVT
jgi:type I restriction enzyme R subunit